MRMKAHVLRLRPGQDLMNELKKFFNENAIEAAFIATCVGSLTVATLRMAGAKESKTLEGPFEIVSLVGTGSRHGGHYHISLTGRDGLAIGGHVLQGCLIHTTAEIVIVELPGFVFTRETDPQTGYLELNVSTTVQTRTLKSQ
jgi:uncharacterized protein